MNRSGGLKRRLAGVILLGLSSTLPAAERRPIPQPLPDRPGNIFLAGDTVSVPLPGPANELWRLVDYEERELAQVTPVNGRVSLGPLPVGFYRLRPVAGPTHRWVSLAVLARLQAPTPRSSPIGLDVAMAWFYPPDKMPAVANLCALAGVNWVRDRLNWAHMEPERGRWVQTNHYDASARAQAAAGLRVLQVAHLSPKWANPVTKRFPLDLRDAFRFWQAMARRWRGQVQAFEPWNEADITMFGGHTGAEMASMQKAAYLGLKAGAPEAIGCLNVFALANPAHLLDLQANVAWPYFDTYNFHHYEPFDRYPQLYAEHRAVCAGRPLWVTECALPVKWAGDPQLKEPTDADLRLQAERVVQTFACALHEGPSAVFYFLLPHYVEGQTQFGLLRPDLTPRPGYVALAAVGRWLADARPLGRLRSANPALRAFLFEARPDGRTRAVLVAWATNGPAELRLPMAPEVVLDHLGRLGPAAATLRLSNAPVLVVLRRAAAQRLDVDRPPQPPPRLPGPASPLVLQALWPQEQIALKQSAYRIRAGTVARLPLYLYNLGRQPASGRLRASGPADWQVALEQAQDRAAASASSSGAEPAEVTQQPDRWSTSLDVLPLPPQERKELRLVVLCPASSPNPATVRVQGDFGANGQPVLSLRLLPQ